MASIHERIAELVDKECGGNRSEFARRIKVSPAYVSQIYSGDRVPSDRTISDIGRAFHISEKWILTGEGDMYEPLERNAQITRFVGDALAGTDPSVKRRFVTVLSQATTEELEAIEKFALRLAAEYKKEIGEEQ